MVNPADFAVSLSTQCDHIRKSLNTKPRDYNWRKAQLLALQKLIIENDQALSNAMWKDIRKSAFECAATEQGIVLSEIADALKNLSSWMKPEHVSTSLYNQIGRSRIVYEPLGVVLIIGAWNYPVNLLLAPLVGAIAGGNGAVLKPSEIPAETAKLISELIPRYLDPDLFAVVQGGPTETDLLLDQKFDLIFFTGSGNVGKIILTKAAVHLTPVVLELGGKSPAVVGRDANLSVSARRIAWGKFMNAGQTCVAPDYVLVHPEVRDAFVGEIKLALHEFYGTNVIKNSDYGRIINEKNFNRLNHLKEGLEILHGGASDLKSLFIEPTLVNVKADAPIMQEEIFGPILPLIAMSDTQEIIEFINARPKPLALYVFTKNNELIEKLVQNTSSGALCVNDVVIHMPEPALPFGGVGASGMGNYHGKFSFQTFTHAKGVLDKSFWPDIPVRYPPYTKTKAKWLKRLFEW